MPGHYKKAVERAADIMDLPAELPERPAGFSGTPIIGGRLGSEYEHLLEFATPRRRALTISKMLRTSAILSIAEEYLAGQVTSVKLSISRDGKDPDACEAVERWLGIGKYQDSGGHCGQGGIDALLRHLCSARTYGHCAMSESYRYDPESNLYYIEFHRRRQESYDTYITEPGTERLVGITQRTGYIAGAPSRTLILPINETLWIVHRPDLGWYDGRSVLRSCFGHWRSEQAIYALNDLAASKYSDPPLRGKLDVEKFAEFCHGADGSPPNRTQYEAEIQSMRNALKSLHSDENAHILYPSWWSFDEVSKQHTYDPNPLLRSAEHHQRAMAERLYIAWITQGRKSDGGSRSMVDVQSKVVESATVDIMQWLLTAINRQSVRRFMRVNYSNLDPDQWPVLSFERGSIVPAWWQTNAAAFVQMVGQGILTMSEHDERAIRAASDLPEPDVEALPGMTDRLANQVGNRLKTAAGQREAAARAKRPGGFVDRLVDREDIGPEPDVVDTTEGAPDES